LNAHDLGSLGFGCDNCGNFNIFHSLSPDIHGGRIFYMAVRNSYQFFCPRTPNSGGFDRKIFREYFEIEGRRIFFIPAGGDGLPLPISFIPAGGDALPLPIFFILAGGDACPYGLRSDFQLKDCKKM